MEQKYFVSYSWADAGQSGFGNAFMTANRSDLTQEVIEEFGRWLTDAAPGGSVVIINIVAVEG